MSVEDGHVHAKVHMVENLAESCEQTCSSDEIDEKLRGMVNQVMAHYAMNRFVQPFAFDDMPTTVTVEANATCPGGKRKLFGGFKCALETTCQLTAVSERPDAATE